MRIFRYIQLCFLLLSIGVFTSCFDDEGNYEYKELISARIGIRNGAACQDSI